jgi:site-specific recombinase XerD
MRANVGVRRTRRGNGRTSYELIGERSATRRDLAQANRYLRSLEIRGLSAYTVRAYAFDIAALLRWFDQGCGRRLKELQQSDLLDWVATLQAKGDSPTTINRRLTTCGLLYRFCTGNELPSGRYANSPGPHYRGRGRDHALGLHARRPSSRRRLRVKVPRRIVEPLDPNEVRAFLRSLRRYRDIAIVHLMLLCGLRSQEVLNLKMGDALFDERRIRVLGKGDRERVVPMPELLAQSLGDYLRLERPPACASPRLFVVLQGPQRGQPMTPTGLRSLFRHRRRDPSIKRANAHRFRHTFGADMARAGVRLPILQALMGHADGSTTLQYVNLSMADIAEEYQRASAVLQKRYQRASELA